MELEPSPQSIDDSLAWYLAITNSVSVHRVAALSSSSTSPLPQFIGFTIAEIDDFFRGEQLEVEGMCIVNIVAAAEAAIRADYRERVRRNKSEALSQAYAAFRQDRSGQKIYRPDFDRNGILDAMRSSGVVALHLVSNFRHLLKLRHWYAHGRHWLLRTNAGHDAVDAHAVCADLISAIDAL